MITEYRKEPGKKYLILMPGAPEKEFAAEMLSENKIPGLLPFEKKIFNGNTGFFYDVSGKHALCNGQQPLVLSGKKIRRLLQSLYCVAGTISSFFLEIQGIVLEAEYIFEDMNGIYFCYNPSEEVDGSSLELFATRLLEMIDDDDDDAVEISYQFYKMIKEGDKAVLEILEEVLSKETALEEFLDNQEFMPEAEIFLSENAAESEIANETKGKSFRKRPDERTMICFVLLFLVSVGYLIYLFYLSKKESFRVIMDFNSGIMAVVFIFLSVLGMATAFVNIDIKAEK